MPLRSTASKWVANRERSDALPGLHVFGIESIRPAGCCLVACPKCCALIGVWCRQDRLTPNGKRLQVNEERSTAAGRYASIGWHTFRHTYRSWLDETGAPMKVQQELMHHASIQTTMNVYGQAMASSKREATARSWRWCSSPRKRAPNLDLLNGSQWE